MSCCRVINDSRHLPVTTSGFIFQAKWSWWKEEKKTNCTSSSVELRELNFSPLSGESCLKAKCFVCTGPCDKYSWRDVEVQFFWRSWAASFVLHFQPENSSTSIGHDTLKEKGREERKKWGAGGKSRFVCNFWCKAKRFRVFLLSKQS